MKSIMLINVKMPTSVGIITFIRIMINATSESSKERKNLHFFSILTFKCNFKISCSVELIEHEKGLVTPGPGHLGAFAGPLWDICIKIS